MRSYCGISSKNSPQIPSVTYKRKILAATLLYLRHHVNYYWRRDLRIDRPQPLIAMRFPVNRFGGPLLCYHIPIPYRTHILVLNMMKKIEARKKLYFDVIKWKQSQFIKLIWSQDLLRIGCVYIQMS